MSTRPSILTSGESRWSAPLTSSRPAPMAATVPATASSPKPPMSLRGERIGLVVLQVVAGHVPPRSDRTAGAMAPMTSQQEWAIAILQTRPDQAPGRIPSGADPGRSSVRRGFAPGGRMDESGYVGISLWAIAPTVRDRSGDWGGLTGDQAASPHGDVDPEEEQEHRVGGMERGDCRRARPRVRQRGLHDVEDEQADRQAGLAAWHPPDQGSHQNGQREQSHRRLAERDMRFEAAAPAELRHGLTRKECLDENARHEEPRGHKVNPPPKRPDHRPTFWRDCSIRGITAS